MTSPKKMMKKGSACMYRSTKAVIKKNNKRDHFLIRTG